MTRPRLHLGSHLWPGLAAVALFLVIASVSLRSPLGQAAGFPADASITASIGYALFNLGGATVGSEGFLAPFEIVDVVLVAALVGAVMLARRRVGGQPAAGLRSEPEYDSDSGTGSGAGGDVE